MRTFFCIVCCCRVDRGHRQYTQTFALVQKKEGKSSAVTRLSHKLLLNCIQATLTRMSIM